MFQSKGDDIFHSVENLFPGSAKGFSCFLPGKPSRPACQKQHVGSSQRALSIAPRDFLDDHCLTAAAIDASHGIKQKDQKAPKRNELETPFGELITTRGRLMAARTDRPRTFARTDGNLNTLMIGTEAGLLVNESREAVTAV